MIICTQQRFSCGSLVGCGDHVHIGIRGRVTKDRAGQAVDGGVASHGDADDVAVHGEHH